MRRPPLDGATRRYLEGEMRRRQRDAEVAEHARLSALATAAATRRVEVKLGPMQPDMPVLVRYHLASPVKGANLYVQNPSSDPRPYRFDNVIGVELPDCALYAPGARESYPTLYVSRDDSDWPDCRAIVAARSTWRVDQETAFAAFARSIRATSSVKKLVRLHPWVAQVLGMPNAEGS